jgi:hypothetical protein
VSGRIHAHHGGGGVGLDLRALLAPYILYIA